VLAWSTDNITWIMNGVSGAQNHLGNSESGNERSHAKKHTAYARSHSMAISCRNLVWKQHCSKANLKSKALIWWRPRIPVLEICVEWPGNRRKDDEKMNRREECQNWKHMNILSKISAPFALENKYQCEKRWVWC